MPSKRQHRSAKPRLNRKQAARLLHRIATVRREQLMSIDRAAELLRIEPAEVERQERETNDIRLRDLYAWQQILDVPITELLVDSDTPLPLPTVHRVHLIRLLRSMATILKEDSSEQMQVLAHTLVAQIVEVMPELRDAIFSIEAPLLPKEYTSCAGD